MTLDSVHWTFIDNDTDSNSQPAVLGRTQNLWPLDGISKCLLLSRNIITAGAVSQLCLFMIRSKATGDRARQGPAAAGRGWARDYGESSGMCFGGG